MIANPAPAMKNVEDVPIAAIMYPASAGVIMRVPCQIAELRATALTMTLRFIRCGYNAWRAGWSNALTAPVIKAMSNICQTLINPETVKKDNRNI